MHGVNKLYRSLTVSTCKVISILEFSELRNPAAERVCGYLIEMVGNMSNSQLQSFLRFATSSSVLLTTKLSIQFNGLSGLARRPIAHTCDHMLEILVSYTNYHDFHSEWMAVLQDTDMCWRMDCI